MGRSIPGLQIVTLWYKTAEDVSDYVDYSFTEQDKPQGGQDRPHQEGHPMALLLTIGQAHQATAQAQPEDTQARHTLQYSHNRCEWASFYRVNRIQCHVTCQFS